MCWSPEASIAMVALGAASTALTQARGAPPAIWLTLGYFTLMEALQVAGYVVIDQCGTPANRAVTALSYLHIVFQPLVINAFAMELVSAHVRPRVRAWVFGLCALSGLVMLAQVLPVEALGRCDPATPLCAERLCTVAGNWHIAWEVPVNGLMVPVDQVFGRHSGFPTYAATVFLLPLIYGAWRFVLLHAVTGPILALALTNDLNEMPAVWCLFSIAILLVALVPGLRASVTARRGWGLSA